MAESITKQNFISLIPNILNDSRSLNSLKLQRSGGLIEIADTMMDKNLVADDEIFNILLKKWKVIGSIVSEILCEETNVFWVKTFH